MSLRDYFEKHFTKYFLATLATLEILAPLGHQLWINNRTEKLGKDYAMVEVGNSRIFTLENRRYGVDEGMDGTLDRVFVSLPISGYMGGPGYRHFFKEITDEDRKKFDEANSILGKK